MLFLAECLAYELATQGSIPSDTSSKYKEPCKKELRLENPPVHLTVGTPPKRETLSRRDTGIKGYNLDGFLAKGFSLPYRSGRHLDRVLMSDFNICGRI